MAERPAVLTLGDELASRRRHRFVGRASESAAADLPRAGGADFVVDGRRYGLFAPDRAVRVLRPRHHRPGPVVTGDSVLPVG